MGIKKFKEKFRALLHLENSTRHLATSFAVGVFIAFSPLLGLHTILALLCVWGFRLNMVALFLGCFVNNPWTLLPILGASFWVGTLFTPGYAGAPPIDWSSPFHWTLWSLFGSLRPYVVPFFIGSTILGLVSALVGYVAVYYSIQQYRERIRLAREREAGVPEKPL